jgi:hypothetical protein
MKKIVPGLLFTLMLIFAACSDGDQSPVSTVKSMFGALNRADSGAWKQAFCDSHLGDLMFINPGAASDLTYREKNRREETAEVEATGTLGVDSSGQPIQIGWVLQMQKKEGGWCVRSVQDARLLPESPAQVVEIMRNPNASIEF